MADLKARHLAYLHRRLTGPEAKEAWRRNVAAGLEGLLETPVSSLFSVDALERALREALSAEALRTGALPVSEAMSRMEVARLRQEPGPVSQFFSDEARDALNELLARPGLVPADVLREVIVHPAVEDGLRAVLKDALSEFSEKVNPFFAEWGPISLLKKLSPFGLGAMSKSFEGVQKEFDRRLQQEMTRFIEGFSRRALAKLADFVIDNLDEPKFVDMRREVAAWLLDQPVSELMPPEDEVTEALALKLSREITVTMLTDEGALRRRRALLELMLGAHGKLALDEALKEYGAEYRPSTDAVADALWPAVETTLAHPPVRAWIDSLVTGFYDELLSTTT